MKKGMTILKLKSIFYRYTGIFLAYKEQRNYLQSGEFSKKFSKIYNHKDHDMNVRNTIRLIVGMWEADNGFARPFSFIGMESNLPKIVLTPIRWCVNLFTVIKWDIQDFVRTIKNRF